MSSSSNREGDWMESLLRITMAGFGGAIAGLSISRGRGRTLMSTASARRLYVDPDLPSTWAVACMMFVGVMECSSTWIKPTSRLQIEASKYLPIDEKDTISVLHSPFTAVVGDYTIGGLIAGAIFKGSNVTTEMIKAKNKVLPPATHKIKPLKPGFLTGIVPGAVLGFMAGCLQVGIIHLQDLAEIELQKHNNDLPSNQINIQTELEEEKLAKEVSKLSTEELEQQIKDMKGKTIRELNALNHSKGISK